MDSHSGEYILLLNKAREVKLLQTDHITMASFWQGRMKKTSIITPGLKKDTARMPSLYQKKEKKERERKDKSPSLLKFTTVADSFHICMFFNIQRSQNRSYL